MKILNFSAVVIKSVLRIAEVGVDFGILKYFRFKILGNEELASLTEVAEAAWTKVIDRAIGWEKRSTANK